MPDQSRPNNSTILNGLFFQILPQVLLKPTASSVQFQAEKILSACSEDPWTFDRHPFPNIMSFMPSDPKLTPLIKFLLWVKSFYVSVIKHEPNSALRE